MEAPSSRRCPGVALTPNVLVRAVAEDVVLSQGEVGIFLSHVTAWREVLEHGLPFAVILEDDAHLAEDFRDVLASALADLSSTWAPDFDVLALDFGLPGHADDVGATEVRPHGAHERCHAAAARAATRGARLVRLDQGCAHASIGGYVLSWRGAEKLLRDALPVTAPVDTHLLRKVRDGTLDAFAVLPPVAHVDAYGTSDSVRRYMTIKGNEVHFTYSEDAGEMTCINAPCQITIKAP